MGQHKRHLKLYYPSEVFEAMDTLRAGASRPVLGIASLGVWSKLDDDQRHEVLAMARQVNDGRISWADFLAWLAPVPLHGRLRLDRPEADRIVRAIYNRPAPSAGPPPGA